MESLTNWLHWPAPWNWLSPTSAGGALLVWLSRRKGWHPWRWLMHHIGIEQENGRLRADLESSAVTIERLRNLIVTLTDAGAAVIAAQTEGRLTTSNDSSPAAPPSPAISSESPRRRSTDPPVRRSR